MPCKKTHIISAKILFYAQELYAILELKSSLIGGSIMKKVIALILSAIVLLTCIAVGVSATDVEQPMGDNLALSATAQAISEYKDQNYDLYAGLINDGDRNEENSPAKRWTSREWRASTLATTPIWCQLAWDEPVEFNTVDIYEYKAGTVYRTSEFKLSVSDDGVVFTDVYEGDGIGQYSSISLKNQVSAKYLRLTIYSVKSGVNDMPCFNEIEVYNYERPIARRATVTASDSEAGFEAYKVNDGSLATADRWSAGPDAEAPVSLTYNWVSPVKLDSLMLYEFGVNGKYLTKAFTIEASYDGSRWEKVFEGQTIGDALDVRLSRKVTVKALRITFTDFDKAEGQSLSLIEIEMFDNDMGDEPMNIARLATPSASSSLKEGPVSTINDGNLLNRHIPSDWATMPITITLSWDTFVVFDNVKIYEWLDGKGQYRADEIAVEVSKDNTNWDMIYEGNGIGACLEIKSKEMVTAKYLRLSMKSIFEGLPSIYKPCIQEIEVTKQGDNANILGAEINGEVVIDSENSAVKLLAYQGLVDTSKPMDVKLNLVDGATATPDGPQNFSNPVTYTVTSPNGKITREYVFMVEYKKMIGEEDLSDKGSADVEAYGPTPSPSQYKYQKEEMAAFCHFGMKTFLNKEAVTEAYDISEWTLAEKADTDGYVRTLKEAGFDMIIFTAKHHDGLCMWDTKWTDYNVTNTVYGGDFLAELSASCNKYDMDMGVYLQPWDVHSEYYGYYDEDGNQTDAEHDVLDYNDFYAGQLEEILSNPIYGHNGKFREIWLDGAKISGIPQDYDFERYVSVMKQYEGDDVVIFGVTKHAKVRWTYNERGLANEENWSKASGYLGSDGKMYCSGYGPIVKYKDYSTAMGVKEGNMWMVNEVDTILTGGWFWGPNKAIPKDLENLREIYLDSVGHNSVLLLNVPFNTSGNLDPAIANRIVEFGSNIKQSFEENNLLNKQGTKVYANEVKNNDVKFSPSNVFDGNDDTYWTPEADTNEATIRIDFDGKVTFDSVVLEEAIQYGQRVEAFKIFYKNDSGSMVEYSSGTTIGGKRVVLGNAVTTDQILIYMRGMINSKTGEIAAPVISHVGVHKATTAFEKTSGAPEGFESYDNSNSAVFEANGWTETESVECVSGGYISGTVGQKMTMTFSGTKAFVMGNTGNSTFSFNVSVDGNPAETVTYEPVKGASLLSVQRLYETDTLSDGEHTIEITVTKGEVAIDALFVLNNGGKGYLEFENKSYTFNEDMSYEIKVVRKGGTKGSISALIQDIPGSAVQTHYYNTEGVRLDFAEGETEKTFIFRTMRFPDETGTLSFTLEIISADEDDTFAAGFNTPVLANIIDAESYDGAFVKSFEIESLPDKLTYKLGDSLDLTGLKIKATYVTGDTRILYADQYKADVTVLSELGETTVTLSAIYDDASVSFKVNVAVNGDVNGDGKTDICDLVAIQLGNKAGDLDGDGDVDKDDAAILRRHLIGEKPLS